MYISIKVKNYKCFVSDNDCQGFDNIKPINIIIGKNNSGKSKLLEVMKEIVTKKPSELSFDGIFIRSLQQDELLKIFPINACPNQYVTKYSSNSSSWSEVGQYLVNIPAAYILKNGTYNFNNIFLSSQHPYWKTNEICRDLKTTTTSTNPFEGYKFLHLQAERNIEKEKIDYSSKISEYPIHSSASGICSLIAKMLNDESGNVEHWQEFIEKNFLDIINTIVAPEIKFSRIFTKTNEENTHELYLEEENKGGIKLSDCGSGLKTIIATLALLHIIPHLTQSYKNVFAFEELENNMHPSLERKLLYHIRLYSERYPESLIFLTTHSNVAIDLFGKDYRAQIVRVSNDGYKSIVESVISDRDKQMLLDDLGVKASDILQSNCLIWVEGPSDRIYVKKWIDLFSNRKFEEGLHYQFILYGGSLLSHYSVDKKDFISLLKINRHSFVVMDSDKTSEKEELKSRVQRITRELPQNHWVTAGKEIENYLPEEALSDYFQKPTKINKNQQFPNLYKKTKKTKTFDKVNFALEIIKNKYYTKENLSKCFDLETKIKELIQFIEESNSDR